MLRPDDSHDLRLHEAALDVDPQPSLVHWAHDAFDNSICFLEWPESLRTDRLSIVSTLELTHHPDGPPKPIYSLDPCAEAFPFAYAQEEASDLAGLAEPRSRGPGGIGQRMGAPDCRRRRQGAHARGHGSDDARHKSRIPL